MRLGRLVGVRVLALVSLACHGFDPCPDDRLRGANGYCACQSHQYTMPGHPCCDTTRGSCRSEPDLPPLCRAPVQSPPRVVMPVPITARSSTGNDADIRLCEPMRFEWVYVNGMAGTLAPPDGIVVPVPELHVSEPSATNSEVQEFVKAWPSLEPCQPSLQFEAFFQGLLPDFDTSVFPATFVANLAFLPPSAGRQTTSVRADLPDDISQCL